MSEKGVSIIGVQGNKKKIVKFKPNVKTFESWSFLPEVGEGTNQRELFGEAFPAFYIPGIFARFSKWFFLILEERWGTS